MVPAIMHDAEMIEHVQGYQAKYLIFSFQDAVEPAERLLVSIVEAIPKFGARDSDRRTQSPSHCAVPPAAAPAGAIDTDTDHDMMRPDAANDGRKLPSKLHQLRPCCSVRVIIVLSAAARASHGDLHAGGGR